MPVQAKIKDVIGKLRHTQSLSQRFIAKVRFIAGPKQVMLHINMDIMVQFDMNEKAEIPCRERSSIQSDVAL